VTREQYVALIAGAFGEFAPPGHAAVTEETRLFGGDSPLDSTALVSLVVEVEQQVNDECGTSIVLADDRAMSQKRSPFRSVGSLADYVLLLVSEQAKD